MVLLEIEFFNFSAFFKNQIIFLAIYGLNILNKWYIDPITN